jgi:molybdopterin/thiamine biosynthesis adenylyltransferase
MNASSSRYSRQERFAPISQAGQSCLAASRVLICGCGALGSVIAERLGRAGVGHLRIVDRDWVELSNLQRQTLFTEQDAIQARPKSVAAAAALRKINSEIAVEPIVEDITFQNMQSLAQDCDLIIDGTDNFETRFLLNDYCVQQRLPWIHGGCLGASGQVLSILPGETACFRCLVPELPAREALETCDSAGVLGPAVGLIACLQAAEALKILSGNLDAVCRGLIVIDSWHSEFRVITLPRHTECKACGHFEFPFLTGEIRTEATILCGKNAVQIESPGLESATMEQIAERLQSLGQVQQNAFFVRLQLPAHTLTIFRGGRTVVEGTTTTAEAKSVLARTLGA